jgi:hypothetical protein
VCLGSLRIDRARVLEPDTWEEPEMAALQPAATTWFAPRLGGVLAEGTRLRRLTATSRILTYHTRPELTLFEIDSGPFRGDHLMVITYGPSDFASAEAGATVVLDHPPAHDPTLGQRLLAKAREIVTRGERYADMADRQPPPPLDPALRALFVDALKRTLVRAPRDERGDIRRLIDQLRNG